jgi:hypothetical protein
MDRIELVRAAIASHEDTARLIDLIPYVTQSDWETLNRIEEQSKNLQRSILALLGMLEGKLLQLPKIKTQIT